MKEYRFTKKLPKESTSFRLAPEAKRQLEKEAKEYGLTLSDYIAPVSYTHLTLPTTGSV